MAKFQTLLIQMVNTGIFQMTLKFSLSLLLTSKVGVLTDFFAENSMKMKEFGSREGASLAPSFWICQWNFP